MSSSRVRAAPPRPCPPVGARRVAPAAYSADVCRESLAGHSGRLVGLGVTFGSIRARSRSRPRVSRGSTETGPGVVVVVFALVVSMLVGVAVGILPAISAAHTPAQEALRESRRTTASPGPSPRPFRAHRNRSGARGMAPVVGAGLLLRSFVSVLGVDPGFQADKLLTWQMNVPPRYQAP